MISIINFNEAVDMVLTEAVFAGGKVTLQPIVDQFQVIKDVLDKQIGEYNETLKDASAAAKKAKTGEPVGKVVVKKFNPEAFWRNTEWKKLEDIIQKAFGLRVCKINPYNEKYIPGKDIFESNELNAYVYRRTRYPVEGLITEKGFFDKSRSIDLDMYISLGIVKNFTAAELVAIMLHEFGHSIDPALCDIRYTGTNIMCKYITDRKGAINKEEQKLINDTKQNVSAGMIIGGIALLPWILMIGAGIVSGVKKGINAIIDAFRGKEGRQKKKLEQLQKAMEKETIEFNRKEYSEAFADNFARMYGFGPEMATSLKKLSKDVDKRISRIEKEKKREEVIFNITASAIKDVHKTDVHRVKALIKEYYADINDPNTPAEVKKQLKEDVKEVEIVLEQFMNDFSEFQNRINKLISDELDKMSPPTKEEVQKESVIMESHIRTKKGFKPLTKDQLTTRRNKDFADKGNKKSLSIDDISPEDNAKLKKAADIIFEKTKLPTIRLMSSGHNATEVVPAKYGRNPVFLTKFGGYPYWPRDMEWPKYKDKALLCIAQLNFSDLPDLPDFPSKGIMQFFIINDDVWDVEDDQIRVVYHKDIISDVSKLYQDPSDFPRTTITDDFYPIPGVTYLKPSKGFMGITVTDDKFDDIADEAFKSIYNRSIDKDLRWELMKIYYESYPDYAGHRIGGHPYFVQTDVREDNHEVMLVQIDSEGDILWGDTGIAHFFCSKETLKSLNFKNKVMFTWDCC